MTLVPLYTQTNPYNTLYTTRSAFMIFTSCWSYRRLCVYYYQVAINSSFYPVYGEAGNLFIRHAETKANHYIKIVSKENLFVSSDEVASVSKVPFGFFTCDVSLATHHRNGCAIIYVFLLYCFSTFVIFPVQRENFDIETAVPTIRTSTHPQTKEQI